jgi:hypothetical protein
MKRRALSRLSRTQLMHGLLLSIGLLAGQPGMALQVQQMQVQFRDGAYQLTMTALLAAPLPEVESVLRNYAQYPQLDARILTAQVLSRSSTTQLELQTRINVCFSFLCRKVERIERVEERPGELLATVIPERSDAERGSTRTQLRSSGDLTRVTYTTDIVPKFWVPALLGRSMMLHSMRDATVTLFEHIEQRAAHLPSAAANASAGS